MEVVSSFNCQTLLRSEFNRLATNLSQNVQDEKTVRSLKAFWAEVIPKSKLDCVLDVRELLLILLEAGHVSLTDLDVVKRQLSMLGLCSMVQMCLQYEANVQRIAFPTTSNSPLPGTENETKAYSPDGYVDAHFPVMESNALHSSHSKEGAACHHNEPEECDEQQFCTQLSGLMRNTAPTLSSVSQNGTETHFLPGDTQLSCSLTTQTSNQTWNPETEVGVLDTSVVPNYTSAAHHESIPSMSYPLTTVRGVGVREFLVSYYNSPHLRQLCEEMKNLKRDDVVIALHCQKSILPQLGPKQKEELKIGEMKFTVWHVFTMALSVEHEQGVHIISSGTRQDGPLGSRLEVAGREVGYSSVLYTALETEKQKSCRGCAEFLETSDSVNDDTIPTPSIPVTPTKAVIPVKIYPTQQELHRELLLTHRRGLPMRKVSELQKVLEKVRLKKKLKEEFEKKKTSLDQALFKRLQKQYEVYSNIEKIIVFIQRELQSSGQLHGYRRMHTKWFACEKEDIPDIQDHTQHGIASRLCSGGQGMA
ncbi:F107B protein, partial [Polypterus senegalus]